MKPQPTRFRHIRFLVIILILFQGSSSSWAQSQLPECTADVPFFIVDLSANPDSSYTTPEIIRKTGCCGDDDNYVSFYVTLHPDVAMFELIVAPNYADPGGSGNYTIISGGDLTNPGSCGTQIAGGGPICITGPGPHKIVYSKPGANKIKYIFRQIPKPIFPTDQPTRFGCSLDLPIYGLNAIQVNAIAKSSNLTASLAACDSMLSCLNCATPTFQAISNPTYPYTVTYAVTGTPIAQYCGTYTSSDTFTITVYSPLDISFSPDPARFCEGGTGIQLNANGIGGYGTYNYLWLNSTGDTLGNQSSYFADSAQNYTLVLSDELVSSTCLPEYQTIPVITDSPPTISAGSDTILCATEPLLFLHGTSSTGSGIWSGGNGTYTPNATSLTATYHPTLQEITDGFELILTSTGTGAGCAEASDTIQIQYSDSINITLNALPIACYNGQTIVSTTVTGGIEPLNYLWNNGASGSSVYSTAGNTQLFISDSIGCAANSSLFLPQPDPLYVTVSSSLDTGSCSGSASSNVTGGSIPYTYQWSSGSSLSTASDLCAGIDTLIVIDGNGCQFLQSFVINNPTCENFNASIDTVVANPCYEDSLGAISVITSGGTGPYSYSWNTNPITYSSTALNLPAGNYTVLVEDALGCLDIVSGVVLQPTQLLSAISHSDVTAIGGTNGSATVNPIGGTPTYTYLWSPSSQTTQTAINLNGTNGGQIYQVEITDANDCIRIDSVLINEPPCNDFLIGVSTQSVTCFGGSNGSASLVIADGTPPFFISWSTGETNVYAIDSLTSGSYVVSVTDSSNCTTFNHFTITQPSLINLALTPTQITCNGDADGSVDLTVFGGSYPYTYNWYNNSIPFATHEDLYALSVGNYAVHVTDRFGCSDSATVTISQPNQLQYNVSYLDNSCYGNTSGSIDLTIIGGVLPYSYSWSGPSGFNSSTSQLNQLASGLYTATVTDLNNCSLNSIEVYINQPDSMVTVASIFQEVECIGGTNGSLTSITQGGTSPYTYAWYTSSVLTSMNQQLDSVPAEEYVIISTDSLGCTASDTIFLTTVIDTINPSITCIANQTVATQSTTCTFLQTSAAWNASASDNCTVSTLSYVLTGATTGTGTSLQNVAFSPGVTTVTWTATDNSGNTNSCAFTVTVVDSTAPSVISCALTGNQQVSTSAGLCYYLNQGASWNPTATDNCSPVSMSYALSGATSGTGTSLNNVQFMPGTTNVNWTISDTSGNVSYCTYSITVIDNQDPQISCIANQTVATQSTTCTFLQTSAAWNASASDNCTVSTLSYVLTGATTGTGTTLQNVAFSPGVTTVTWTATDNSGNTNSCAFTVTVADSTAPSVITCALTGNQQISTSAGLCYYLNQGASWNPTATDNCSQVSMSYALSGATSGTGTSLNGVQFLPGTTNVNWTISDTSGNVSYCTYSITVIDNQDPQISCIANQTVATQSTTCNFLQSSTAWNASASDNCTVSTLSYVLTGVTTGTGTTLQNVAFSPGVTTVTWTATDNSGNTNSCAFTVTVADSTAPSVITCALTGNQQVSTSAGLCYYLNQGASWNPTATDNCSPVSMNYTLSGATSGTGTSLNGVQFMPGTTNVNWTISDTSGNVSYCAYSITVIDNQDPQISCIANQTVATQTTTCTFLQTSTAWNASASDNCTVSTLSYALTGATTGTGTSLQNVAFSPGVTTVTWTATDNSGNTNSCAFTVTVVDSTSPSVISCALTGNQQVSTSAGLCYYLNQGASWNPSATDNCSPVSMNYTLSGATSGSGTSLNGVQFLPGTTNVNWTISDTSGNISYCAYSITVIDNQDPQISCIANQTVATQTTTCTFLQTSTAWNASASDNCTVSTLSYALTGATTGTGTSLQNVAFSPGTTTVTWTATDNSGNTNSCAFTVTVVDSTAPSVISCALTGNQQVSTSAGLCYYLHQGASWNPSATDNCSPVSMNYTLSGATSGSGTSLNGVQFLPGTTNVNWTISDTSGNISYCAYSITVTDTEAPAISGCPQNISVASQSTICGQWVEWNSPLASDNCSVSMTESLASGTYLPVGLHTINYIAIDGNSNTTTCSFTVNVLDTTPPIVACPSTIHSCQSTVSFGLPNMSDNCAVQSVLQTQGLPSQSQFPIGQTTNTYLVTDIHGNSSTCSFTVDIHTLPIITLDVNNVSCYDLNDGAIDATVTNAVVPITYSWTNEQTTEDIDQLAPGNYTLTVSDNYGCQSTSSAVITEPDVLVLSGDADSVSCFNSTDGGFDLSVNGGTLPYLFSWSDDSSMEDLSNVGSGTYSVTVSDGNGCIGELTTVILSPEALTIQSSTTNATCTSSTGTVSINVSGGTIPYVYEWSNGSTESNLTNVPSGLYTLTITDNNNCSVQNTMLVESSTTILAELSAKPALCAGIADGSIHATVIEGTPPYTYEWSNGASTPSLEALYAGNFSVVITDSYGCKDTVFAELFAPDTFYVLLTPSVYSAGTNISTYGNDDGFILTSIQGGNSSYTYSWSTGSIQSDIYDLTAGNYAVIVTNENGCEVSASITLTQPNALALPSGFSPNGDNDNDFFVVRGIESYPDNDIVIFNRWGNVVYQQNDYTNQWDGVNRNGEELPDGTYFVILQAFGEETITLKGYVDLRR